MSPLIDAGTNDPLLPATDLDGEPRIMGGTVDMGVYELGICTVDENSDSDGDGYTACGGDCNDNDGSVNPSAVEVCGDGIDNNCNGTVDEGCGTENTPPVASFGSSCTDLSCNFTDTSIDSDGSVVSWSWNFGDGANSTAQNPTHNYSCPDGNHTVMLSVTDDDGATDMTNQQVTVTGDCGSGTDTVTLEQVASTNHGSTWTATVKVTVVGSDSASVDAAWSGGVSANDPCTTSSGTCTKTSPGIR